MFALLSSWLDHTWFPKVEDPEAEAQKVAVLRVAAGSLLVWRCTLMLRDSLYYFDPIPIAGGLWPLHALASAAQLIFALGLTLGVAPSLCAMVLLCTHSSYSVWTGTYNLGPMLLMPTLGAFAVLETGQLGLTSRRRPAPDAACYRAIYAILFIAYAGWSFQALLYHVRDTSWIGGYTPAVLFTSSYLSEFYGLFRAWEAATPKLWLLFSAVVVVLQSVFQLAMLPLMATRPGARFVHLWGWAFILGSLVDLQLSILPLVEVIMWALIFSPARWYAHTDRSDTAGNAPQWRTAAIGAFCGTYAFLLLLFFFNAVTGFIFDRQLPGWVANRVLFYSGLVAPNVFNRQDLTMGDRWPVIERVDRSAPELVPFTGPDGERLAYHRSDLLYFGNSLRWRRGMIDVADLVAYHQPGGDGYEYARRVALYDYRRNGAIGAGRYRVQMFRNHATDTIPGYAGPERHNTEPVYEFVLQVGPKTP